MRHIRYLLALTSLILILVACSPGSAQIQRTPTVSLSPTPTPGIPAGTVLFQSDWSKGLSSWGDATGWTIAQGAAQSDSGDKDMLTIPYVSTTSHYALEVHFQIVNVPASGGEFIIQALPMKSKDGYTASVLNLLGSAPHSIFDHPQIQIYTLSLVNGAGSFHPEVYIPGTTPHTFRLAVQGPEVDLFVDGNSKGSAVSSQTDSLSTGPFQIIASGVVMRISNVRITAL